MVYKANPIGYEVSCDMYDVQKEIVRDNVLLTKILLTALKQEKFTILNISKKKFNPQGFSINILLAESDASLHTFPEYNFIHFHLYSCRGPKDGTKTLQYLIKEIKPLLVKKFERQVRQYKS